MPKSMHENKGQRIDKAPFLHLFQNTVIDPELEWAADWS